MDMRGRLAQFGESSSRWWKEVNFRLKFARAKPKSMPSGGSDMGLSQLRREIIQKLRRLNRLW